MSCGGILLIADGTWVRVNSRLWSHVDRGDWIVELNKAILCRPKKQQQCLCWNILVMWMDC